MGPDDDQLGADFARDLADGLPGAALALVASLDDVALARAVSSVPDAWLEGAGSDKLREAYLVWLTARRAALPRIIEEATSD